MNSLEGSHCYALEDNILTSLNMFFNASRISKQCCADLHVPAKKSNETKHNPSHFNRASSLLRFINIQKWTSWLRYTFKVSCNGRGKTTELGMVELEKSHTSMVLVLSYPTASTSLSHWLWTTLSFIFAFQIYLILQKSATCQIL